MSLVPLIKRLLGRHMARSDVTRPEVRDMIRERQEQQEARLRRLDLQAGLPDRRKGR